MLRRNPERAARPVDLVDHAEVAAVEIIDLADEDDFVPVVQQAPIWPAAAELVQDCAVCFSVLGTNGPPMACPLCGNVLCLPCVQQAFAHGAGTMGHVNQCPIARCEVRDAAGQWLPGREFRPVTAELMRLHAQLRERDGGRVALRGEALAEGLAEVPVEFDDDASEAAEILVEEEAMEGAEVLEFGAVDVGDFAAEDVFGVDGGNAEEDPLVAPLSPVHVPGSPLNVPGGAVDVARTACSFVRSVAGVIAIVATQKTTSALIASAAFMKNLWPKVVGVLVEGVLAVSRDVDACAWLGYHKLRNELKKETAEHTADLKKLAASSAQEKSLRVELARERTKYSKLEASWKAKYDGLYENYCYALSESHKQEDEMKELRQKLNELRQKLMPKPSRCCDCQYEPDRNFDFRGISDAGKSFVRGGAPYIRPVGSMRHALAVYERYDDKQWLNEDDSGWPVAYHGTSRESAAAIIRNGFHLSKGKRFQFGRGIYCTPDPATAKEYSTVCNDGNKRWKCVLQVRVKPGGYRVAKRTDSNDGEYWLVTDSAHIRPYAVCVYAV